MSNDRDFGHDPLEPNDLLNELEYKMIKREVTEIDFRKDEFKNEKPEDWEFRDDGKLVRKDRFYRGMLSVAQTVLDGPRQWEVDDAVEAVEKLVQDFEHAEAVISVAEALVIAWSTADSNKAVNEIFNNLAKALVEYRKEVPKNEHD